MSSATLTGPSRPDGVEGRAPSVLSRATAARSSNNSMIAIRQIVGTAVGQIAGSVLVHVTWEGWAGGVVTSNSCRLQEAAEHPASGVLAAALGVSEAFQHIRGSVAAGRRSVGLSLWDPAAPWMSGEARGPALRYLPTKLWLLGLGHLGQAYLWVIGLLPYRDPGGASLWLQDFDHVVYANRSTGLLVGKDTPDGLLKTRLAAAMIEQLGVHTRLIERPFDEQVTPGPGEPRWALAGFDGPEPRRHLQVFEFAVDLGLGASQDDYLGIHLHTFPSAGDPAAIFTVTGRTVGVELEHQPAKWATEAADDPCGVLQLEGVAVGAAFVGAAAAALGIAEILRGLAGGPPTAVASLTLTAPQFIEVVRGTGPPPDNPGYQPSL